MGLRLAELTNAWRMRRKRGELRLRRVLAELALLDFFLALRFGCEEVCAAAMLTRAK